MFFIRTSPVKDVNTHTCMLALGLHSNTYITLALHLRTFVLGYLHLHTCPWMLSLLHSHWDTHTNTLGYFCAIVRIEV